MKDIFVLILLASFALAQDERTAEQKAYSEGTKIKDAAKRAAYWESFLKHYPDSRRNSTVRADTIRSLFSIEPDRAQQRMEQWGKELRPSESAESWRVLAAEYLKAGKDLPRAETAASRALDTFLWDDYRSRATEHSKETGRKVDEERFRDDYRMSRVTMLETLGEIYVREGKEPEARPLLEEALKDNPSSATAATMLAVIIKEQGSAEDALKYSAQAFLARPSPQTREDFTTSYAKLNGGATGKEDYLDRMYHELFPPPIHPEKYQAAPERSKRVVLAEVYTGAGCRPCIAADLAFDAALERYSRDELAVVMFHEHIPRPDPLTNDEGVARWKWLEGKGVPTYVIDGKMDGGGGPREHASGIDEKNRATIDKRLESPADAAVSLRADHQGGVVKVHVNVDNVKGGTSTPVLHIALVEKLVRYSGENGIRFHPMVARSHIAVELKRAREKRHEHVFDLAQVTAALKKHLDEFEKHNERHNKDGKFRFAERMDRMDPSNLAVVAWVQDMESREVLQAAWAEAPEKAGQP